MPAPVAAAAVKVGKQAAKRVAKAVLGGKKGKKSSGLWWKISAAVIAVTVVLAMMIPSMIFTVGISALGGAGGAMADDPGTCAPDGGGVITSPVSVKSMSPAQVKNVQWIIAAAKKRNLDTNAMIVAVMVGQVEAGLLNLAATGNGQDGSLKYPHDGVAKADHKSVGLFQQQPAWGDMKTRMTPVLSANTFFMGTAGVRGLTSIPNWESLPKGVAAQTVQVSAFPDRYALYENFATQAVKMIEPSVSTTGPTSTAAGVAARLKLTTPGAVNAGFVQEPSTPAQPATPTSPPVAPTNPAFPTVSPTTPAPSTPKPSTPKPTASPTTPVAGTPCLGQVGSGNLNAFQKTLVSYAWPKYYGNPHTAQTPGYAKAVNAAMIAGRFVGATSGLPAGRPPGDDCGGFVTTLMHDSGWDPTYNYGGMASKGAGGTSVQLPWLQKHWKLVGYASQLKPSDLHPGDVGISSSAQLGHTWVYVGQVPGFNGNYAAASWLGSNFVGYAPNASPSNGVAFAEVSTAMYFRKA